MSSGGISLPSLRRPHTSGPPNSGVVHGKSPRLCSAAAPPAAPWPDPSEPPPSSSESLRSSTYESTSEPRRASSATTLPPLACTKAAPVPLAYAPTPPPFRGGAAGGKHGESDAARLARRQQQLEHQDCLEDLFLQEARRRATLAGREYEARHKLQWAYQYASAQQRRELQVASDAKREEEKRRYACGVAAFQAQALLAEREEADRAVVMAEEKPSYDFIASLAEMSALQAQQKALLASHWEADVLYENAAAARRMEQAVALMSHRPTRGFVPKEPMCFVSSTVIGGTADELAVSSAQRRVQYLMDYTVNEEEFAARQCLRREAALERMHIDAAFTAQVILPLQAEQEKTTLRHLLHIGSCEARLASIIKLQRWWRLIRRQSWVSRRRQGIGEAMMLHRSARTARELQVRMDRMIAEGNQKQQEGMKAVEKSEVEIVRKMAALEEAATGRGPILLDYYIFTLCGRVAAFEEVGRYDIPLDCQATTAEDTRPGKWRVPDNVFQRYRLPYATWRQDRWALGAADYISAVTALEVEEANDRQVIVMAAEARNRASLAAIHACLSDPTGQRLRTLHTEMAALWRVEYEERSLIKNSETNGQSTWGILWAADCAVIEAKLRPFTQLVEKEHEARGVLYAAQEATIAELVEQHSHWRWSNLATCRVCIAKRYPSLTAWRVALHAGAGYKFESLVSAGRVIRRCLYRARRLRRAEERRTKAMATEVRAVEDGAREVSLSALAAVVYEQLQALQVEQRQRRVQRIAAAEDAQMEAASTSLIDPSLDTALEETPALDVAVSEFSTWFGSEAERPRELYYREVVARFHKTNEAFYQSFNFMLAVLREGREKIEEEEVAEMALMRLRLPFRLSVVHTVATQETRARMFLEAYEEDARDDMLADVRFMKRAINWGVGVVAQALQRPAPAHAVPQDGALVLPRELKRVMTAERLGQAEKEKAEAALIAAPHLRWQHLPPPAGHNGTCNSDDRATHLRRYVHNGPSLAMIMRGELFPPEEVPPPPKGPLDLQDMTPFQRLEAREDVRRARLCLDHSKALSCVLMDFSLAWRRDIQAEEEVERAAACAEVDSLYPFHPPIAGGRLMVVREAEVRQALARDIWASFSAPLLRLHNMYGQQVLWPKFTFGHLTMAGHAEYMDVRLRKLLVARVAHVATKLKDLIAHEAAARERVEYIEEITRVVRFEHGKLV